MMNLAVNDHTYARVSEHDSVIVVLNNGAQAETIEFGVVPARLADGIVLEDRLGVSSRVQVERGAVTVRLPPRSASLYVVRHRLQVPDVKPQPLPVRTRGSHIQAGQ